MLLNIWLFQKISYSSIAMITSDRQDDDSSDQLCHPCPGHLTGVVGDIKYCDTADYQPLIVSTIELHCWTGPQWNWIGTIEPHKRRLSIEVSGIAVQQGLISNSFYKYITWLAKKSNFICNQTQIISLQAVL